MAEEETKINEPTLEDALAQIEELKKNSVPREEYEKTREANRTLLQKIVNGRYEEDPADKETPPPPPADLKKMAREINLKQPNNLEYARRVLAYRDASIRQGKGDPFLAKGERSERASTDASKAERAATLLRHCVEYADENGGDNEVFTNEIQRLLVDPPEVLSLFAARARAAK